MPLKDDEDNGLTVSKSDYEAKGKTPEGSTVPVTSTKGGTDASANVTARVGGSYSGLSAENKIDSLRIQGSGAQGLRTGGDTQESVAVIGESGNNVLIRMENKTADVNDFQEIKLKFTELNL